MSPEELLELVADGESLRVELKGESRHPLNDRDLVEAVVCLANRSSSEPGWLFVGIEDDGQITGARQRHEGRTDPRRLQALLANRTRPSLSCPVEVVEVSGREVIAIEVPTSRAPVSTTEGIFLRRALGHHGAPECLPMSFYEPVGPTRSLRINRARESRGPDARRPPRLYSEALKTCANWRW